MKSSTRILITLLLAVSLGGIFISASVQRTEIPSDDMYKDNCVLWARAYRIPDLPFGLWTLNDKIAIINDYTASPGCAAVIQTASGHIAYVKSVDGDIITIEEANWGKAWITTASGTEEDLRIIGYYNPRKSQSYRDDNAAEIEDDTVAAAATDLQGVGEGSENSAGVTYLNGVTQSGDLPLSSELTVSVPGFTDIGDLTDEELRALSVLTHIGLIKGYGNNTFAPYAQMNRAEFTYLTVHLFMPDLIKGIDDHEINPTLMFFDVPGTHWAYNYIYLAAEGGVVSGNGNNNFTPNEPVLYPHAVKILVSMLGYDRTANSGGGYPTGYMRVADRLGLNRGIRFIGSEDTQTADAGTQAQQHPLRRIEAVMLIYNALDTRFNRDVGTAYTRYFAPAT